MCNLHLSRVSPQSAFLIPDHSFNTDFGALALTSLVLLLLNAYLLYLGISRQDFAHPGYKISLKRSVQ